MCDGVAARFDTPEALCGILRTLQGEEFKVKDLQTFMCNGVAARFDAPEAATCARRTPPTRLATPSSSPTRAKFPTPPARNFPSERPAGLVIRYTGGTLKLEHDPESGVAVLELRAPNSEVPNRE